MASHTYVQYFIPGDGDSEEHPNVFLVKRPPRELRLEDVAAGFPLPGLYFFRAKQPLGKAHMWVDLSQPSELVPSFGNKVVLKVARLSLDACGEGAGVAGAGVAGGGSGAGGSGSGSGGGGGGGVSGGGGGGGVG